jgi:fructokinase
VSTIAVAGEALIDVILRPDGTQESKPGGGPFNAARTIGRLGTDVVFLSRLSDDRDGRQLAEVLHRDRVRLAAGGPVPVPTTRSLAMLDDTGHATYRFELDGTNSAQPPADPPPDTAALHVGSLGLVAQPGADRIAGIADATSALVMVDPNCRPAAITHPAAYRARLARVLGRAAVVKASTEDLAYLHLSAPDLLAAGASLVIITDGSHPIGTHTSHWAQTIDVPKVTVVDSIGAGDALGGAFLAWWVRHGLPARALTDQALVRQAVEYAAHVAAITCTRRGADPPWAAELGDSSVVNAPSTAL